MRKLTVLLLLAAGMAWTQCRIIDDFTTGKTQMDLRVSGTGTDTNTQAGSMIGGLLHVNFFTYPNPFLQLGEAKVQTGGPLTVPKAGRDFFRLYLFRPITPRTQSHPIRS